MAAIGKNLRQLSLSIGKVNFTVTRCLTRSSGQENMAKVFTMRSDTVKKSHSRMLSEKDNIFALYTENIIPSQTDSYLSTYEKNVQLIDSKKDELHCGLIGSWMVNTGELDQALHLWQYTGGFQSIDQAQTLLSSDKDYKNLLNERSKCLRSRHLQYMLAFSYWPQIEKRSGANVYEVRSYTLKPGTMIEWGNNWARGINHRRKYNEAFAGLFSHVGRLCEVYHIWCYKDLQSRKEARENAWREPGWDDCVAYTVPLIQTMHSRILHPTSFSPTK